MSWLYSQVLVAAFSEALSLDGRPFAESRSIPIPQAYCSPAKMTTFSLLSRFGMIYAPLMDDLGAGLLTWYLEASRAKTSAPPARALGSLDHVPDSGEKCTESFARFNRRSSSWRIPRCSRRGDSTLYLGRWPRWGTMRNGECSERTTSARLTSAKEFGYLHTIPTPTVCNAPNSGGNTRGPKSLKEVAATNWLPGKMWPTPTVQDSKNTRGASQLRRRSPPLNAMVRLYPTPRLTGMCGGSGAAAQIDQLFSTGTITDVERTSMRSGSGGALNPQWVAWLMGWPLGWSSLQPLAMDKFQQWRRLHS